MRPRQLFILAARAEVITWTLLIAGMVLKHLTHTTDLGVRVFGLLHGVVFLWYVLVVLALWINHRWPFGLAAWALIAGVIPFATYVFERWARRRRELSGAWRLGRNGSYPYTFPEKLLSGALNHPFLALVISLLVVGATTAGLLTVGPPTQWLP